MSTVVGSNTGLEVDTLLPRDDLKHSPLICSKSSRLPPLHIEPISTGTEFDSVDRTSCHACDHHASTPRLFRIRLATYGVSIIIVLGICSVPMLLVCCFGEKLCDLQSQCHFIFSIIVPIIVIFALPALSLLLLSTFRISLSPLSDHNITQFSPRPPHPSSRLPCTCPNGCTSSCTLSISCVQFHTLFQDRSRCDQVAQRRLKSWLSSFP